MLKRAGVVTAVLRDILMVVRHNSRRVTKSVDRRSQLESCTIGGNSPVVEIYQVSSDMFPSSTGHVESRVNQGGPPPKAKYYSATDSG